MKLLLALILLITTTLAQAAVYTQYSFFYYTDTDNNQDFKYSTMRNSLMLGAELSKDLNMVLGWNAMMWDRKYTPSSGSQNVPLSMTELGPRLIYFWGDERVFYNSVIWNPYAKGKRTVSGTSEDISGYSVLASAGFAFKITKTFRGGFAINYHTLKISEKTVGTTTTKLSESYNTLYPSVEFSYLFK